MHIQGLKVYVAADALGVECQSREFCLGHKTKTPSASALIEVNSAPSDINSSPSSLKLFILKQRQSINTKPRRELLFWR